MRLDVSFDRWPADVARPRYERRMLRAGIVHLGLGAFARAHLAVVNEAVLHAAGDLRWGIVGVSLRHADTRNALEPQHGLYTVAVRDAAADGTPREALQVVGCITELLVAAESSEAVLERIAAPETRIVSLTVTEKGYCHDPATGALRFDDPAIAHDLGDADAPSSAIGLIVRGLDRRRRRGLAPLTLLSCDNLPANGRTLQGLVLEFAGRIDPALRGWIAGQCTFPNSMVDRIVPRTTDADREQVAARLGVRDSWPVIAEPFLEWVVEDRFAAGRPAWNLGGARFVAEAEPYERLKLRMVNGSHSALAYLGSLAAVQTIDRVIAIPALRRYVDALQRIEIAPTLPPLPGFDLTAYRAALLQRFANPALQHRTRQIAIDGSQKLPQRLLHTIRDRLDADAPIDRLALAIAAWIAYLGGADEAGTRHSIDDPLAAELAQQLAAANRAAKPSASPAEAEARRVEVFCGYAPVFGALGADPRFVAAVARQALSLRERGVLGAVDALR